MIEVKDLGLVYKEAGSGRPNPVIQNLSLSVEAGESVAIIGPSGCGKSSLLYILSGLLRPSSGNARIAEQEVTKPRQDVALMLQESGLLPWKSVWDNATLGSRKNKAERRERLQEAFEELGIAGMEARYPSQISGGEKRRVSLARALAQEVKVILMDEPLAALDTLTKEATQNLILTLWKRHSFTLVLVTHDIEEALFLGQRVLIFAPRPTHVVTTVENPKMGEVSYRQSQEFFDRVQQVRGLLQT
ncbi:ABC transporter ATP-binding protein [Candidatus Acetothermia bacterium]|nr:ABC transporter ATP-binding protein [Candidatus Acetothermia bacterium]MBI3642766.1 ABC transporter ATP-binding protein [Candidatus Acetothermia bacterium]